MVPDTSGLESGWPPKTPIHLISFIDLVTDPQNPSAASSSECSR